MTTEPPIKLNLGCGNDIQPRYINVDKFGNPDLKFDLETFPWPWSDNSVTEIRLIHVLEHLGQDKSVFLKIMQEIYRVSEHHATLTIHVPHPRHHSFLHDPTHVRPITAETIAMFSKKINVVWQQNKSTATPLGLYLDVDFELKKTLFMIDGYWQQKLQAGVIKQENLQDCIRNYNNVVEEIQMEVAVIK